jgi:hypothetical protein
MLSTVIYATKCESSNRYITCQYQSWVCQLLIKLQYPTKCFGLSHVINDSGGNVLWTRLPIACMN